MKDIAKKVENITNISKIMKLDQLDKYDETIQILQNILPIEKSSYIYPQIDTIGKNIYTVLNKV